MVEYGRRGEGVVLGGAVLAPSPRLKVSVLRKSPHGERAGVRGVRVAAIGFDASNKKGQRPDNIVA